MKIRSYFRSFSLDELCSGMELLLSGEGNTEFRKVNSRELGEYLPECFDGRKIQQLSVEYKEYQDKKTVKSRAQVWLDEEKEVVLKSNCGCKEFKKDYYGCSHTAAALSAWYLEKEGIEFFAGTPLETGLKNLARVENPFEPGVMKRTDSRLLQFLQNGQEENALPVWEEKKIISAKDLVHTEYSVSKLGDMYFLEMKAGISRSYVIKDIPTFYQAYHNMGLYSFGKTDCVLSAEVCDDFTNGLMDLIGRAMEMGRERNGNNKYFQSQYGTNKDRRFFVLDDYFMCEFLKLLDGSTLKYSDGREIPVCLERKGLEATLRKKTHGAVLQIKRVTKIADDHTIELYFQDQQGIFRVQSYSMEDIKIIRNLVSLKESLYVRESDIPALSQNILSVFEKYGKVVVKGIELQNYELEKPELEVYLDIENKSVINCVPYTVYKEPEARFRLFDNSAGNKQRNAAVENQYAQDLVKTFQAYDPEAGRLSAYLEDEELYQFLQERIPDLQEKATVYISDRLKNMKVRNAPKMQVSIGMKSSGLLVALKGADLSERELQEILSSYSSKKKYFRLKNGAFFNFENADTQIWDTLADLFQHHGGKDASLLKVPLYRAMYLNEMLKGREELLLETDDHYQKLIHKMGEEEKTDLPAALKEVLRPYQEEGFHWIRRLKNIGFGGILADDMGLGKTLQILAFLLSEKQAGKKGKDLRTLIVCPASLVYNWKKEIEKFTPELSCMVIAGTQAVRQEMIENSVDVDVWVTSYDLLKRDIALYENITFANEIIDEAQFIKNQHTQAAQSVRIVSADFRMALTGTPIENHLGELWSILDYLMPGFLYNYSRFQKEYETPIANQQNDGTMEKLRKMIHPFILRRLKKDVLKELPEKLEEAIVVKLEGEQKSLYEAYASRLRMSLEQKNDSEFRSSKLEVLAELTRLRQLCCDPSLLVENYHGENAKLDACMELVQQAVEGGHKVLLFSQFTSMLDIICSRLSKDGYAYYRIDGSVSKERRMDMVDSFDYDEVPVFCISLKAGGTGLNLTAADIVIHYDPWWNQAAQNQATDRAHRIGQTNSVSVYELIAGDTIEEQIQNIKKDKAKLMEDVLSGESVS
ncbi:MAG: SNF2-related protein, partial [Lachnospiraceae bacterium]|nr:SNF2-related protein [Lachnospiraceae bacterium]